MTRSTIDFGIDLGTTNSEIAVFKGASAEVVKDNENFENTPSAVWIDARGRKFVGRKAKDRHLTDPGNSKIEFKRQMGNAQSIAFKDCGKNLLPEELSAEVLLQLKANVKQWMGEDISAAVITVPADFNAAQIEATNRAARLAGFDISPLVNEPVAAATAYGFQDGANGDNVRWLVYDLGGGTFDAALVRRRDGMIRVENHGGDKTVGGKDLDWAIVEELLVPALLKQARLSDFNRGNAKWIGAFAKLKIEAELAKIQLSRSRTAVIEFTGLCNDDREQTVEFEFELQRADLERLAESMILKSIHICKQVLSEARLSPADIGKLILVGGPTMMPYLRERLADRTCGLGIPLEFGVDPFTVVARGAAIYAATLPLAPTGPVRVGEYQVKLDYQAIGPDDDPSLSGQVVSANGENLSAYTIEFINRAASPPWRSGKVGLSPDGRFMTSLWAQKGLQNQFSIELANAKGILQKTVPQAFPYTIGSAPGAQTLMHNIGVGLTDNTVMTFFEKGATLPARKRVTLITAVDARRGSATDAIRVPVVEGENARADRNEVVGCLAQSAVDFARDVPAGSEVEVLISVNESRRFTAQVFVPMLDEEFPVPFIGTNERRPADKLAQQVDSEKKRLAKTRERVREHDEPRASGLIAQIDAQRLEHELDAALAAARLDQDAGDKCESRLHDLQVALDDVDEELRWPALDSLTR